MNYPKDKWLHHLDKITSEMKIEISRIHSDISWLLFMSIGSLILAAFALVLTFFRE